MKLTIEVTPNDIVLGTPGSASKCAFASAIKRTMRGRKLQVAEVFVYPGVVVLKRLDRMGFSQWAHVFEPGKVPAEITAFVEEYDKKKGKGVKARSFEVEVGPALNWSDGFGYFSNEGL